MERPHQGRPPQRMRQHPTLLASLQLPVAGSHLCLYEDGTELTEDYFRSVPDNSELLLLTSGQTWHGCEWLGPGREAGKLVWLWRCQGPAWGVGSPLALSSKGGSPRVAELR